MGQARVFGLAMGLAAAAFIVGWGTASAAETPPGFVGTWRIHADQGDASVSSVLELRGAATSIEGSSGPLDTLGAYPLTLHGEAGPGGLHLLVLSGGETVGAIDLRLKGDGLVGVGRLFGTPVVLSAERAVHTERAPRVFDFDPTAFHVLTSNAPAPVLHLVAGDKVRTRTVDNYGRDEHGAPAAMPGNPGTGPFYVDDAMPGDTLVVHILKLTPNRDTARMARSLDGVAVTPGYAQTRDPARTDIWRLDLQSGTAHIATPSARLKHFQVALRPMLGVVGVAPPSGASVSNSDLGAWGGNLDFPEMRAGVTLYLPVFQPGGMLFIGDAHARQGDGEVTGQGLETSMSVEFQVDVIKGKTLGQPWSENAEEIMVSGVGGSLNDALQRATTGMAKWLKDRYQLDDTDVAAVLGSSLELEIAEVVDPKFHVVAKLKTETLSQIASGP